MAFAVAVAGMVVYHSPWKSYEVLALAITVPWVVLTFGRPATGRLHWVPAGLVGGFLLLNYQGYLMYAAVGIGWLMVATWRAESERRTYVIYLVKSLLLSAAVAAPFLLPFLWTRLTGGGQYVADLYPTWDIANDYLPFLSFTLLGVIQLVGLAGMLTLWKRASWAAPLLVMTLGTYAYRLIYAVYFVLSGHTGMIHHAAVMTQYLFLAAGLLTLGEAARWGLPKLQGVPLRQAGPVALVCLAAWTGIACWMDWTPNPRGNSLTSASTDGLSPTTVLAFTEPDPNGHRARNLPVLRTRWFPITPIRKFVEARLGAGVQPRTLSYDERLFSYLPWRGYTSVERTAALSTVRWDDRFAELVRLEQVTDPAAFAQASAHTKFGAIDVFILQKRSNGWVWEPYDNNGKVVVFQPAQFSSAFDVTDALPGGTVVAVRRPA
jgi:hypothetical protein